MSRSRADANQVPHELLLTLFNSVSEGVFAVDLDFRITAINDSALKTLGISRRQAMGRPCGEVIRSTLCDEDCPLRRTLASGEPLVNLGSTILDGRGRRIPISLSTTLLKDAEGEVIGGVESFVNLARIREHFKEADRHLPLQNIVTGDPAMKKVFEILPTISRSATSILVNGETGTGKNLLVRAIHNLSARARGPLITVNCAALPETLLESELFGYKAGAFTGAARDKPGRFAAAEGGTLFLDEVGDIPLSVQVKLLRVLQERVYERLGEQTPIPCDIRFITATHRDLATMVAEGQFRRDLYYRINVLNVDIPPLRARKGDIPLLAQRFIERFSLSRNKQVTGFSSSVLECLMAHDYPGNVRELENIIEHAWVMCPGNILEVQHLPRRLQVRWEAGQAGGPGGLPQVEAAFLTQVLERHGWHRENTARELGIHRTTLQRKIKKLGLIPPPQDGRSRS
jgi:PAS domain S-box-containing protein|nr:sigma 54-interacting transcriptional regulator [Candidatus Krumholzibacteria bacterium]